MERVFEKMEPLPQDFAPRPLTPKQRRELGFAPEPKTRWLSEHLPNCVGYHVISGGERFFMYSQADTVNQLVEKFLI